MYSNSEMQLRWEYKTNAKKNKKAVIHPSYHAAFLSMYRCFQRLGS